MRTLAVALTLVLALTSPVLAHMTCYLPGVLSLRLTTIFGESIVFEGVINEIYIQQTWLNPETLSWTTIIVKPDGTECMLTGGAKFSIYQGIGTESMNETPL